MKKNFLVGALSIISAQFIWSTIEISGVFLYKDGVNPITLLNIRYLIAFILMLITIFLIKRYKKANIKNSLKIKKKDLKIFGIHSFILLIHLLAFWQGLKLVGHIPTAIGVYYTFPLWIVIFSIIFWKEKITKYKTISLTLGFTGSLFIVGFLPYLDSLKLNTGTGLMFLAAISWAIYTMIGKSLFKKYHFSVILFYNFLFVFLATLLMQSPFITIGEISVDTIPNFIYLGVICTYIVFLFFYNGVNLIKPSTVGIISYIKPIIGIGLAFLVFHQVVNLMQMIGIIFILLSSYLIYQKNGYSMFKK